MKLPAHFPLSLPWPPRQGAFENPTDANQDNIYQIEIEVTDGDNNKDTTAWGVTVDNVKETANFTINTINDEDVLENKLYTLGQTPTFTPSDPSDPNHPIGTVTYSLPAGIGDNDLFLIATSGEVTMIPRDFEAPADENNDSIYEATIKATDSDGNDASQSWMVEVTDDTND